MKKLLAFLVPLILVLSCEQFDDSENFLSAEQILGKKEYAVHKGILTFRDKQAFLNLSKEFEEKTPQQLDAWESDNNFKSLRSVHEEAIQKEEVYLQEMLVKYPNNTTLARKELGYTKFSTDFINKGLFVINEFETLDMNVTAPHYGAVVNADGIFRIGDNIIMPQLNLFKVLSNADVSKISLLKSSTVSDEARGIKVLNVTRNSFKKDLSNGKTQAWTSCDDSNDGYRLIVYEEQSEVSSIPPEYPCDIELASYWLKFRSLKRILGTWQNHNTSLWYVISTVNVEHWKRCEHYQGTSEYSYLRTVINYADQRFDIPYGHTQYRYYFRDYDIGPCASGGLGSCPPFYEGSSDPSNPYGVLFYITRIHNVYGKGGTYCYVGQ